MEKKLCRFLALVLAFAVVFSLTGCASGDYKKALAAFDKGDYAAAAEGFKALGDYEDSADKLTECRYQLASAALYDKRYEEAMTAFEALGDYKDSKKQLAEANSAFIKEKLLGNYSVRVTDESLEKAMNALDETLYGGFSDFIMNLITNELEAQGLTLDQLIAYYGSDDLNEIFTIVLGMDVDELYELAFGGIFSMDAEDFGSHGSYTVEDGRILLHTETGNEVAELDITADRLTLTGEGVDLTGMDEQMKQAIMDCYPMVYTRG